MSADLKAVQISVKFTEQIYWICLQCRFADVQHSCVCRCQEFYWTGLPHEALCLLLPAGRLLRRHRWRTDREEDFCFHSEQCECVCVKCVYLCVMCVVLPQAATVKEARDYNAVYALWTFLVLLCLGCACGAVYWARIKISTPVQSPSV